MASPEPDAHGVYNNGHRAFLQAFMSRGTMTFDEAKPILAHILTIQEGRAVLANDVTTADFHAMIHAINPPLHALDLELAFAYPQTAPSRTPADAVWALVNLASDPFTQLATTHAPEEIAFVRRVLDAVFETNNVRGGREIMAVRGMDAINLARPPRGRESGVGAGGEGGQANTALTKDRAEKVLISLVEEGWFERSRAGWYSLSPRSLIELKGWLVETYNDEDEDEDEEGEGWQRIKTCNACREIVTIGQRCADADCACRFHDFCARGFFNNQREKRCPTCKTEWTGNDFVGERAASGPRPSGSAQNRQSNASRRQTMDDEDEDDTDD